MALFESKEVKKAKREVAIRMGKKKVSQYVGDCQRMAERYAGLAKRALALGQTSQCDQYLFRRIQYDRQSTKWESFLLRMEDLSLRGQMSGAISGLIQGMQALTKQIQAGVSVKEMTKTVTDLNVTMTQLEQTEDQLTAVMDGLDYEVGSTDDQPLESAIPQEMQAEVERMRTEMMDEVVVQEKVGSSHAGVKSKSRKDSVDNRIQDGLNRIKDLKKK